MILRPYQIQMVADVRDALRVQQSVLAVAPTGAGKTVMFANIARSASIRGNRAMILVHRQEIMEQTLKKLFQLGVVSGQIASGKPQTSDSVQTAMVMTLARRLQAVRRPDLLIVDECHHALMDNSWGRILDYWRSVPRIGFTATPERLDGRGLGDTFKTMILGPSTAELVREGFLSVPVLYRPPNEVTADFRLKRGDFDTNEQQEVMSSRKIVGDVIAHYKQHMEGMPAIVFCVSVKHSMLMAEQFAEQGFRSAAVYGDMDKADRERALNGLADGSIQIITSCDLISEGFDTPAVAGVILLRRTLSLGLYLQQVGRALRPFPGKTRAVVLDHAGNYHLHGHPLAERQWSLESAKRTKRSIRPPTTTFCPECHGIWPGLPQTCPGCGHAIAARAERKAKPIKVIEGELVEAGIDGPDAQQMAQFLAAAANMDKKTRQKALLSQAFELAAEGEEGRRKLDALRKEIGYGPGWVKWAWDYVSSRRAS